MSSAHAHNPLGPLRRSRDGPLLGSGSGESSSRAGPPPRPVPPRLFEPPFSSGSTAATRAGGYAVSTAAIDSVPADDLVRMQEKIAEIQRFISGFDYNYSGKPFVKMNRSLGMLHVTDCARQIISIGLPIQCVEAVFLAAVLTAELSSPDTNEPQRGVSAGKSKKMDDTLDRLPLSFKSKMKSGAVHRHIVLALQYKGKWGALGISRRDTLMYKPLIFDSLGHLIWDYKCCYEKCFHILLKAYVGLPLPKDAFASAPIKWRAMQVRICSGGATTAGDDPTAATIDEELQCFLADALQTPAPKLPSDIASNQSKEPQSSRRSPSIFDRSS